MSEGITLATEIRNWVQFIFLLIGGIVGLVAFFQNIRQRKIENSLKMIKWFQDSIKEDDISSWENLFRASSEPAGAKYGFYVSEGSQNSLSDYFSEGSPDSGSIGRISDCLEVICHEMIVGTVDARFVWFELGQLIRTIHQWLGSIEMTEGSLLESAYPSLNRAFKKNRKNFKKWPSRTYAYVE